MFGWRQLYWDNLPLSLYVNIFFSMYKTVHNLLLALMTIFFLFICPKERQWLFQTKQSKYVIICENALIKISLETRLHYHQHHQCIWLLIFCPLFVFSLFALCLLAHCILIIRGWFGFFVGCYLDAGNLQNPKQ